MGWAEQICRLGALRLRVECRGGLGWDGMSGGWDRWAMSGVGVGADQLWDG
jgi:hypothetical protein